MSNCDTCNCDLGVEEFIVCDRCKDLAQMRTRLSATLENLDFYRGKISDFMGADLEKANKIKELESRLKALEAEREWVKCGERLPEVHKWILIHAPEKFSIPVVGYRSHSGMFKIWGSSDVHGDSVTHWMPLPAGPDEKQNTGQD